MINKIIKAIANDIKNKYENINVYTEEVKQGFERPCFSVICVSSENNIFRGQRYRMTADIEIHYYNDRKREDYNNVMLQLFDIINYVNVDNFPLRAVKMAMDTKDNYCLFNVTYDFFYYLEEEKEIMGEYMEKLSVIS